MKIFYSMQKFKHYVFQGKKKRTKDKNNKYFAALGTQKLFGYIICAEHAIYIMHAETN